MTIAARLGAGAIAVGLSAAVTAAMQVVASEAQRPNPARAVFTFVVLLVIYGATLLWSTGLANVLWLVPGRWLAPVEPVALPSLAGLCHWLGLRGAHWGLYPLNAVLASTLLLIAGYMAALLFLSRVVAR